MKRKDLLESSEDHKTRINEAVNSIATDLPLDITIVSGDNEAILTNRCLLSLLSPVLSPLLSSFCCSPPTLFLPDCSTSSINNIINIANKNGVIFGDYLSPDARRDMFETAELLCVDNLILMETENEQNTFPTKRLKQYSPVIHQEDATYSPVIQQEDSTYSQVIQQEDTTYSPQIHEEDATYSPVIQQEDLSLIHI